MDNSEWVNHTGTKAPQTLPPGTRVMIKLGNGTVAGPYQADLVHWGEVSSYRRVVERSDVEQLRTDLADAQSTAVGFAKQVDDLTGQLTAEREGNRSALNLQRLFTVSAEVRAARAAYDHASVKLEYVKLQEQIATAISRGHLPSDFCSQLREWSK